MNILTRINNRSTMTKNIQVHTLPNGDTFFHIEHNGRQRQVRIYKKRSPFYTVRAQIKGVGHLLSTETNIPAIAAKNAVARLNEIYAEHRGEGPASKLRNEFATLGEILARYKTSSTAQDVTIKNNIYKFRRIARAGRNPEINYENIRTNELDSEQFGKYISLLKKEAEAKLALDPWALKRVNTTANSALRAVRSIFSKKILPIYQGLKLPNPLPLADCAMLPTKIADTTYQPIDNNNLIALEEEINQLKSTNLELWKAYKLCSIAAMRRSEVEAMRREWVVKTKTGWGIAIIQRPYFEPKGKQGTVPIPEFLAEELLKTPGEPLDHIIQATSTTAREKMIRHKLSSLIKKHLPSGRRSKKTLHELRKHAGSIVASRDGGGLLEARDFLRHKTQTTTDQSYATYLNEIKPLTGLTTESPNL
jgi:integrase